MRTKGFLVLAGAWLLTPQVATAQQRVVQVARAMGTRYIEPACDLKAGHFLVSSAATYLKSGSEQGDPVKSEGLLEKAVETSSKAITEADQGENGAAWYYMGRAYLRMGDIAGADTALTKASQFAPQCGEDIKSWRQRAWLPLVNPATKFSQEGNADSALAYFRMAATISRSQPQGFYNMGVLFANAGQVDSSIAYFKKAQEVAMADAKQFAKDRNSATFNLAAMYQRAGKHAEAVEELRKYVGWDPNDNDAKRALATSLRAIGKNEEAATIDKEVLAAAEQAGTLSTGDLMNIGINFFNEKKYAEAAEAFNKVLAQQPRSRDALFNLSNTYYLLEDGSKLVETATRLVEVEPLNEDSRKLLAQGYKFLNEQDKMIAEVTHLMAMPTSVSVERFGVKGNTATLAGVAVGRQAMKAEDSSELPPAAKTIVVEFLNAGGDVVATKEVAIPALQAGVRSEWTAEGTGDGIVAWRYHEK